jgi:hypothetical protein
MTTYGRQRHDSFRHRSFQGLPEARRNCLCFGKARRWRKIGRHHDEDALRTTEGFFQCRGFVPIGENQFDPLSFPGSCLLPIPNDASHLLSVVQQRLGCGASYLSRQSHDRVHIVSFRCLI